MIITPCEAAVSKQSIQDGKSGREFVPLSKLKRDDGLGREALLRSRRRRTGGQWTQDWEERGRWNRRNRGNDEGGGEGEEAKERSMAREHQHEWKHVESEH